MNFVRYLVAHMYAASVGTGDITITGVMGTHSDSRHFNISRFIQNNILIQNFFSSITFNLHVITNMSSTLLF